MPFALLRAQPHVSLVMEMMLHLHPFGPSFQLSRSLLFRSAAITDLRFLLLA